MLYRTKDPRVIILILTALEGGPASIKALQKLAPAMYDESIRMWQSFVHHMGQYEPQKITEAKAALETARNNLDTRISQYEATYKDRTEGMVEIDQPLQGCLSGHTERWGTMDQNKPLEDGAAARALAEASSREDDWATDGMDSVKPWSTARTPSRALQVRTELAPAALTGARGCCLILARSDCFC